MNKDLLEQILRFWFDSLKDRFRGDIQREQAEAELLELAYELEMDSSFIDQIRKDSNA